MAQRLVLQKQDDGQFRAMSASCVLGRPDLGPNGWVNGVDGWPAWGEDRNAWSLDGLVMPCWLLEGQVVDDEVNAGSGSRSVRRSASSYQRVGVGFGSRWPWKILSWFACDGRRAARRDTRLPLAGWYGMPAACSLTECYGVIDRSRADMG